MISANGSEGGIFVRRTTMSVMAPLKLTEGEQRFYRELGFLLLPGLLSDAVAAKLHAEVTATMAQIGGFEKNKLKQTAEYLEGGEIDRLVNDRNLRDVAEQLLGGPSSVYLPFTAVKGSGGGRF